MRKKKALKYIGMNVGKLFIFSGCVLIGAEIYLGWLDGVWNRYPLSMLVIDTIHFMGRTMGDTLPEFQMTSDMWKSFETSDFPHSAQLFLGAIPMAIFFLISGYFFLRWPRFLSRAKSRKRYGQILNRLTVD